MRIAALDFGTVTSRLMVADVENAIVSPLIKKTTITHLGEGLAASGRISEAAIKRLLEATQAFLSEIDSLNGGEALGFPPVSAIRAVATSAMRDAKNSDEVADALAGIGVQLEVISGDQEARLNVEGTLSGFAAADLLGRTVLVIDVGGGSTELVIARVDEIGKAPQIVMMSSLDIGARRITDLWLKSDPPLLSELNDARDWL
ncbi:MAG: Ppx/GppA family phosphatase, partial [Coriobacteriia bacterium]|nr:Ppx/GppA family phosphatase [Coriobacteriia bacterium]